MSSVELNAIGNRISRRRKQLGLTQEQVAEKIDVSVQMVSNLERGNKAIKIENLLKISKILKISTDYILTGNQTSKDCSEISKKIEKLSPNDLEMINLLIDFCLKK